MGAVQPFLSGAISKTVNMPEAATAEEIETVYLEGWKQGLKAIAIYRDGSKRSQPLSTGKKKDEGTAEDRETIESLRRQLAAAQVEATRPHRHRLPAERTAITHKFEISGHEGYITVGLYPDGTPGEIFLKMAKEGSTISGLMDTLATSVSLALQYGVPLQGRGEQVRPRAVRAQRLHRQPGDPDRQEPRGLHLPLDGIALPAGRGQGRPRADRPLRGGRRGPGRVRRVRPAAPRGRGHHRPVRGVRRAPAAVAGRRPGRRPRRPRRRPPPPTTSRRPRPRRPRRSASRSRRASSSRSRSNGAANGGSDGGQRQRQAHPGAT